MRVSPWTGVLVMLSAVGLVHAGQTLRNPSDSFGFRWGCVDIALYGLSPNGPTVPVACRIDLGELARKLDLPGLVDERSLQLVSVGPGGRQVRQPVQYTSETQARLRGGALRPGTSRQVSYPGEYVAGETPTNATSAGQLAWMVAPNGSGSARFRLEFAVLTKGTAVQVPYDPGDFRMFDEKQRASTLRDFPMLQIRPQQPLGGSINVFEGKDLVTTFYTGPSQAEARTGTGPFHRPFFYPVNGPNGISLTEFGKPHDPSGSHAHHYSLWIAHANVNGIDFWSERGGSIAHVRFDDLEDGAIFCRAVQRTLWIGQGEELVRERREWVFYRASRGTRIIDLQLNLTPAHNEAVTFGKTTFGLLAARVAQSMSVFDGGGEILTARGDRNEQGAHLKQAAWLDQSGPIAPGKWAGITFMDSPQNPGHPTTWHCRNDGWACASFSASEPVVLNPGSTLTLRYRILLHPGNAASARVAEQFQAFANAPEIVIGEPRVLRR